MSGEVSRHPWMVRLENLFRGMMDTPDRGISPTPIPLECAQSRPSTTTVKRNMNEERTKFIVTQNICNKRTKIPVN